MCLTPSTLFWGEGAGTKRKLGCAGHRAALLLPKELTVIFSFMSSNLGHTCTCAALLTGFRAFLRKCQLMLSDSVLRWKDFQFHHWGMIVLVRRYKTIQFGQRELLTPVTKVNNSDPCAVH